MQEKIKNFLRACLNFIGKKSPALPKKNFSNELSKEEKIKILKEAEVLLQKDKVLMSLYQKLSSMPRDGTQKRNFERSEIQLKIFSRCQNLNIATGVISLAEIKSRRLNDETKL